MIQNIADARTFDPARYLTQISGRDYLEVKFRLLWLRTDYPDAAIETELIRDDGTTALFKARVTLPTGGSATGWGSETIHDFGEYIEKAERKSLGRALAALGFGTQFCQDFDGDGGRAVDSPVPFQSRREADGDGASDRQIKAIYAIARAQQVSDGELATLCSQEFGHTRPEALTRREASTFIDLLKQQTPAATR